MARLIDADKRIAEIKKQYCTDCENYGGVKCRACWVDDAMCLIDDATTVDAVELPCKIGDKVYRIDDGNYSSDWKPFVHELTVTEISWKKEKYGGKDLGFAIIANGIRYKFTSIGKSVFLTRKEAEAKLGGDGNG